MRQEVIIIHLLGNVRLKAREGAIAESAPHSRGVVDGKVDRRSLQNAKIIKSRVVMIFDLPVTLDCLSDPADALDLSQISATKC